MNGENKNNGNRTIGIRARLIAVIIPIVLVIIVSFFALSRSEIIKLSKQKLMAESEGYAGDIYAWTYRIFGELQVYKDAIDSGNFKSNEEILRFMKGSLNQNTAYPIGLYMGDDKGVYLDASGWVPGADWVLVERDWYLDGKNNDRFAFGEPYYDLQSEDMCVSASVRMNDPDAVRVLAVDVYLDYVSQLVSDFCGRGGVQSFLVTEGSRTIIAHPDVSMTAVTLDGPGFDSLYANVNGAISQGKRGMLDIRGDDGAYLVCVNEVAGTDWLLVSYMRKAEALAGLRRLEAVMGLIAVAAALVLIFATLHLMNRVVKPVARVTDVIQKVSEGDFSHNIKVSGNDEIARMSAQTQSFLVHMRRTIADIMGIARWLGSQSENNDRVSRALMEASRNQSGAMAELNKMADELSGAAEHMSEQMGDLAKVIEEAGAQGRYAGEMMKQTVEIAGDGRKAAERVSSGMQHIERSISSLSEQIMLTDRAIEQIGSMVEMIVNVADETSLLALNASIEAAHAGDAGRGFAVVAGQIGKLAENSGAAADDISALTAEIRGAMRQAIIKMEESVAEVKGSAELVGENKKTFERVFGKVGDADRIVGQMAQLIGRVEAVAADMRRVAENQVREAGQITESVHELDGYTHAVSQDSGTVAQNAKVLEEESRKLLEHVSGFKI